VPSSSPFAASRSSRARERASRTRAPRSPRRSRGSGGPEIETSRPPGRNTRKDFSSALPSWLCKHQVVVAQLGLEVLRLVVHDDVCAEAADHVDVRRAGRRRDRGAQVLRQLNGERADAARARLDEDLLALRAALARRAPATPSAPPGDRRRLLHREVLRLQRQVVLRTAMSSANVPMRWSAGRA
jgi:hypothetical protein